MAATSGPDDYNDIWKYQPQTSDTYVGVPNDYKAQVGYTPQQYRPDYDTSGSASRYPGVQSTAVYQPPRYKYDDLQNLSSIQGPQLAMLQGALYQAGLLKAGDFTAGAFDRATNAAMSGIFQQANISGKTWQQVLSDRIAMGSGKFGKAFGPSGSGGGGGPSTIVQRQINLTGRAGAFAALQNVLTQALGRDPTPAEVNNFKRGLNSLEQGSPTVTTTHYSGDRASISSTTKQSDVTPEYEAYQAAQKGAIGAEGGRFQANQYVEVLKNMLGA